MVFSALFLARMISTLLLLRTINLWPCGSQIPQILPLLYTMQMASEGSDPRVGQATKACSEAQAWAKIPGEDHAPRKLNWIRKRAYGRACRRAQANGGTMYRGKWFTNTQLLWKSRAAETTARPGVDS